ncbi:MAG: sporulation transcriptional regulator SpoIIID, partial [Clostridia bacterium]|nr:sporulation transcriptional regulator SpoIIID [Clostridia bacterium]
MNDYYDRMIIGIAYHILESKCTVREGASVFGISKIA